MIIKKKKEKENKLGFDEKACEGSTKPATAVPTRNVVGTKVDLSGCNFWECEEIRRRDNITQKQRQPQFDKY